jgi:hypothetical protein
MHSIEQPNGPVALRVMRQLALLICMGLLVNLFHAVSMPVQTLASVPHDAMATVTAPHAAHDCDASHASNTSKACTWNGHLCCQGFMAATAKLPNPKLGHWATAMNPVFQKLILQIVPEPRFKPPIVL